MAAVELGRISKAFDGVQVLSECSFTVEPGKCLCLFGPSGCGKTTTLRIVAGLERPDAGAVSLHGETVSGNGIFVAPAARGVGMVFQDQALWPHMTAAKQVDFVLRGTGLSRGERALRVGELFGLLDLGGLERRKPSGLSGGERQRVAIARALAPNPTVLLLDEPFGNLDDARRDAVADHLRGRMTAGLTIVLATHDRAEAALLEGELFAFSGLP